MNNNFAAEQWREISIENMAMDEMHLISNLGRLRSRKKSGELVLIKPSQIKGYPIVNIRLNTNKRTTRYLHKLVAEAFLTKQDDKQKFVIHLDFNKENNQTRNLKWVDSQELHLHQLKNPNYKKGIIRYSKLTETDVIRLKKKLLRGKNPLYKIAREFGITHTQLNRIRSGENWGHVKID